MNALIAILAFLPCAHAAEPASIEIGKVKTIVCQSTFTFPENSPTNKTPARGIKIFNAGHRSDVSPARGEFLLSEYIEAPVGGLSVIGDQQFYFSPIEHGKTTFEFLAPWKAHGELEVRADGSATGVIHQLARGTELSCVLM